MKKILLASVLIILSLSTAHAESEAVKGAQKDMAAFKEQITQKLSKIDDDIIKIKNKSKGQTAEAKDKAITELEKAKAALTEQINDLEKNSESKWKSLKKSISQTVQNLNEKTQKLLNE